MLDLPIRTQAALKEFILNIDLETLMQNQEKIPYLLAEQGKKTSHFWGPVVESRFQ